MHRLCVTVSYLILNYSKFAVKNKGHLLSNLFFSKITLMCHQTINPVRTPRTYTICTMFADSCTGMQTSTNASTCNSNAIFGT